jgi:hypothetical protein
MSVQRPLPSLSVEEVAIDQLRPDPANHRLIGAGEEELARALEPIQLTLAGNRPTRKERNRDDTRPGIY